MIISNGTWAGLANPAIIRTSIAIECDASCLTVDLNTVQTVAIFIYGNARNAAAVNPESL